MTVTLLITDSSIDTTMGGFTAGNDLVCHTITVFENDVVEPDGTIIVRISNSSLIPPNTTVNMSEAEVTVTNDDRELWVVGLLACMSMQSRNLDFSLSVRLTINPSVLPSVCLSVIR